MEKIKEVHLIFKGRVQGVGFRFMTAKFANEIGLKGMVRNLPDGTVEAKIQGTHEMIEKLIQSLNHRFSENISEVVQEEKNIQTPLDSFKIFDL